MQDSAREQELAMTHVPRTGSKKEFKKEKNLG